MRDIGGESHQVLKPDGTTVTMTFDEYTAYSMKRMVGEIFEACRKKEALPKGLARFYDRVFDVWLSRRAPANEAGELLDGQRTLTVILSQEAPHRPVEVVESKLVEPAP